MRTIRNSFGSLAIIGGLIASLHFVHAQTTARAVQSVSAYNMEVMLQMVEATMPQAAESVPKSGTFYSAQFPNWPPLPCNINNVPVWNLGDGALLLDDLDVDYSAPVEQTQSGMRMMGLESFDSENSLLSPSFVLPDYGTNLWIAQVGISSGSLVGIVTNSLAGISYEIQSLTDLTQAGACWVSEGFILGSELTNWTPMSVAQNGRTNLFLRIRSWADDGSGLPIWWQMQYFGVTGVNPDAFDPTGDGWTIWQDFEGGYNPTVFRMPPAPQGVTAQVNPGNPSQVTLTWLPAQGAVTGYTIGRYDPNTWQWTYFNVGLVNQFVDTSYPVYPAQYSPAYYSIQANYASGGSSWSDSASPYSLTDVPYVAELPGALGSTVLLATHIPPGVSSVSLTRDDNGIIITNAIFPISSFTNGIFTIPDSMIHGQIYEQPGTHYTLQATWPDGSKSAAVSPADWGWLRPPYFDGRTQMEQNVTFLLRAASLTNSFSYISDGDYDYQVTQPNTYTYASYYDPDDQMWSVPALGDDSWQDWRRPFDENYRYRNFLYINNTNLDGSGYLNTGIYQDGNSMFHLPDFPVFQFSDLTSATSIPALDASTWMQPYTDYQPLGMYVDGSGQFVLPNNIYNWFGLHLSKVLLAHNYAGTLYLDTLNAGGTWPQTDDTYYFYPQFDQPQLQTVGYYFGRMNNEMLWAGGWIRDVIAGDPLPGDNDFSPTNAQPLLIGGMCGQPLTFAAFAKKIISNGNTNKLVYVAQYFDKAYKVDTNGNVTSIQTGVLSPWGDFYPTEPGPVALVTMPDINTGQRGTGIVQIVSLQLDANHDGVMDTSYFGQDETYGSSWDGLIGTRPFTFWINNGYIQPGNGATLDQDRPIYPNQASYSTTNLQPNSAYGQIRSQRNLENFARLWICGLPNLPASQGYSVTLVIDPNAPGRAGINLYPAYETDGGTRYLTDTNVAASQLNPGYLNGQLVNYGSKVANLGGWASYTLPVNNSGQPILTHFLFEGVSPGVGDLVLTISQNGQTIAVASAYVNLQDIKNFYEQAEITGVTNTWPAMVQQTNISGFQVDNSPPYSSYDAKQLAVFVHGWRLTPWETEDFSETMFKQLYWQGFQGRFASLRWPTRSAETDSNGLDYLTFNRSEHVAFESGTGAAAYFSDLRQRFTNDTISVCAHSQGNIVMMEALKELAGANQRPLDNYVMMQAAVPAHCYDTTVPYFHDFTNEDQLVPTPNTYANYATGITNALRVGGKIINFFNTNDYALVSATTNIYGINFNVSWIANEELTKPLAPFGYSYNPTNSTAYLTNVAYGVTGRTVTDPFELMPFVARPRSLAVGSQSGVGRTVNGGELDLKTLNFSGNDYDHSGEFNRNIQTPQVQQFYIHLNSALIQGQP
jgi:hypothetical protein